MKSYLINTRTKSIDEIDIKDYIDINKHLESDLFQVGTYIDRWSSIYVDEEGLYREKEGGFIWKGVDWIFSGHGIVNTVDNEGDQINCILTKEEIENNVEFVNKEILEKFNEGIF